MLLREAGVGVAKHLLQHPENVGPPLLRCDTAGAFTTGSVSGTRRTSFQHLRGAIHLDLNSPAVSCYRSDTERSANSAGPAGVPRSMRPNWIRNALRASLL